MPVATIGECKRYNCREKYTDLADGLCVKHWDRSGSLGVGRPPSDVSRLLP